MPNTIQEEYNIEKLSNYLEEYVKQIDDMIANPDKYTDEDEPSIDPMIDTLQYETEEIIERINWLMAHNQRFATTSTDLICRLANLMEKNQKRELTDFVSDYIEEEIMTAHEDPSFDPYDGEPTRRWD